MIERFRAKALLILLLSAVFGQVAISNSVFAQSLVQADVTKDGVTILQELSPGATLFDSRRNLYCAKGAMSFRLSPLVMMLTMLLQIGEDPQELSVAALDQILASVPQQYSSHVLSATPHYLHVDDDGTLEKAVLRPIKVEHIRNFLLRMDVPARAAVAMSETGVENRELHRVWLQCAQREAAAEKLNFYEAHPIWEPTGIVEAFTKLGEGHIYQVMETAGYLYDAAEIRSITSSNLDFIDTALGSIQVAMSPAGHSSKSLPYSQPEFPVSPLGASNAASFSYRSLENDQNFCAVAGEPHLPPAVDESPIGPRVQMRVFCNYYRDSNGTKPAFTASFVDNVSSPDLVFSKHSANSGTANPNGGSFKFFTETDLINYRDSSNNLQPFSVRHFTGKRNGLAHQFSVYEVPGFGEVFGLVQFQGKKYVLTMRRKLPSSGISEGLLEKEKAAINGDVDKYNQQLLNNGTPYWGEAGCAPATPGNSDRSYVVLHQGHLDEVADPSTIDVLGLNSILPSYLRTGVLNGTGCINQPFTSSDNGSLFGGTESECLVNGYSVASLPLAWDPGYQTFRQDRLRSWGRENPLVRPLSREEVINFATETYSPPIKRLSEILAAAIRQYGAQTIPSGRQAAMNALADLYEQFDGLTRDTPELIALFHTHTEIEPIPYGQANHPLPQAIRDYLHFPYADRDAAFTALDLAAAQFLNTASLNSVDFYEQRCIPAGITTWREAVRIVFRGETVVAPDTLAGPGIGESRSSGLFVFIEENGQKTCKINLEGSSPIKHIYAPNTQGQPTIKVLPFGTFLSGINLIDPALYEESLDLWWDQWKLHNTGNGYGDEDSYREVCDFFNPPTPGGHPDTVASFVISVPTPAPTPTPTPTQSPTPSPSATPTPTPSDCNGNGVPDSLEPDSNGNGIPDDCDQCPDINSNQISDCDVGAEFSWHIGRIRQLLRSLRMVESDSSREHVVSQRRKVRVIRLLLQGLESFGLAYIDLAGEQDLDPLLRQAISRIRSSLRIRADDFLDQKRAALRTLRKLSSEI